MNTAVITGSSKGIGFGMAHAFLREGWNVVLSGRNLENLQEAEKTLKKEFPSDQILAVQCDVGNYAEVEQMYGKAQRKFKTINVWINNAGMANNKTEFWNLDNKHIDTVIRTNINGITNGCLVAINKMKEQEFGAVYNFEGLGSDGRKVPGLHIYGMTKYAVRYLTQSLQQELNDIPVSLGTLSPGMVTTDLLLAELDSLDADERKRVTKVYNILADKVETVAPFLVKKIINNRKKYPAIAWLTGRKAMWRFLTAPFAKRDVLGK